MLVFQCSFYLYSCSSRFGLESSFFFFFLCSAIVLPFPARRGSVRACWPPILPPERVTHPCGARRNGAVFPRWRRKAGQGWAEARRAAQSFLRSGRQQRCRYVLPVHRMRCRLPWPYRDALPGCVTLHRPAKILDPPYAQHLFTQRYCAPARLTDNNWRVQKRFRQAGEMR